MEQLIIDKTATTPEVNFDGDTGLLRIEGVSRPEDVMSFYNPIFSWLKKYIENPQAETTVEFAFEYHNSASAKITCKMLNLLAQLSENGKKISVKWYYHDADEDILEAGEDYKSLVNIPFKIIKL